MSFISFEFLILFVCTFLLYYAVKSTHRKYVLLFASFIFIGFNHYFFLLTALLITLSTFVCAIGIDKAKKQKQRKRRYQLAVISLIAIWFTFRYSDEILQLVHQLLSVNSSTSGTLSSHWVFPLGLSFYTFQAISYLTEVYWEEEKPEKDLPSFMVYMLFFMKFLSGPIERSADFLPQIHSDNKPQYSNLVRGSQMILIGLIKKLIVSGSISTYIDYVFNEPQSASGIQLIAACLLYPLDLYADFSGYTDMALGGALILGFKLAPNFNRPFGAYTITDFWRRWHMSLSFWVRDYIYQPLSMSLRKLKQNAIYLSLIITFICMGIWHGAGWNFIIYGFIQGAVMSYEIKTSKLRNKVQGIIGRPLYGTIAIIRTYLIFAFSLIFFRLNTLSDAVYYIRNMSFQIDSSVREITLGIPDHNLIVAGSALLLLFIFEYLSSKRDLLALLSKQHIVIRWTIYFILVLTLFSLGQFSSDNFIYLQF